jgi:hypothetical protein
METTGSLGKSVKTDAVQIRVDPRRRFVLEMIARRWNRPISTVLEEVIESWIANTQSETLKAGNAAWSPFVADRFVLQHQAFHDVATHLESFLWLLIAQDDRYWNGATKRPRPKATESNFNFELLRSEWESLIKRVNRMKEKEEEHEAMSAVLKSPANKGTKQ